MPRIAVYGPSGYTGRLVAAELAGGGHDVVLAGRDEARLRAVAAAVAEAAASRGGSATAEAAASRGDSATASRGDSATAEAAASHGAAPVPVGHTAAAEVAVAPLDDPAALGRALDGCDAVVNCAGPFLERGAPVVEAAIRAGVAYADTAAEQAWVHEVFERYGPLAAARGVALVPAAGFDFVPGDLACGLAAAGLGPLHELVVAYAIDRFRMSRGSVSSALAGFSRRPLAYEDGEWRFASRSPLAAAGRRFAFPAPFGVRFVAPFPAGEVVTAPRHLAVRRVRPLIAARTLTLGAEPLAPLVAPAVPLAGGLVRGPVARAAAAVTARLPEGPGEEARRRARWIVVAVARAAGGEERRVAVDGRDVYGTTAACAAHAAALLAAGGDAGALAPAQAFDPGAFLDHVGANRTIA